MSDLVIVGRYPFPDRKLEGMVQRILNVDTQLANRPRSYLDLYLFKHLRGSATRIGSAHIYTASFLHFWKILRTLRQAREVYVHSVYFYALILLPLAFTSKRVRLILDIHGTVPEELEHTGKRFMSAVMRLVERAAFSRIDLAVCVTRRMERFYRQKYPATSASFVYLPIFTSQVCHPADAVKVRELRSQLGIPDRAVIYLYSGGLQGWQNVDRIVQTAKTFATDEKAWFIFLTAETQTLIAKLNRAFDAVPKRIVVAHARPEELRNYYELATFGFILREDHILNRVANPTKLVEYLYFGIWPIVWSADIGDFLAMGYEYLSIDAVDPSQAAPSKSEVNRRIGLRLLEEAASANLSECFVPTSR